MNNDYRVRFLFFSYFLWLNTIDARIHTDDMIERNSVTVTLHDVDSTALQQLIDYAYTGEITITEDNVQVRKNEKKKKSYKMRTSIEPNISNSSAQYGGV